MITQDLLKELLDYSPDTGLFVWKVSRRGTRKGSVAGCLKKGRAVYVVIGVEYEQYLAHRLAWLYVYGKWPENDIDHRDHNTVNNRIKNLRDATNSENHQNIIKAPSSNSSTGFLGVHFHKKKNLYQTQIKISGKSMHIGYFHSAELAHEAYLKAKRQIHPFGML